MYIGCISGSGIKCHVCKQPEFVRESRYHDIKGYNYGLCNHGEDLGEKIECPEETTACGKIALTINKSKAERLLEELKHIIPDAYARKNFNIPKIKENIMRIGRGPYRRPDAGNF